MSDAITISPMHPEEATAVATVVGKAFAEEILTRHVLGNRPNHHDRAIKLFELQISQHHKDGGIIDVARADGQVVGAAMWERPGESDSTGSGILRRASDYLRLLGTRSPMAAYSQFRIALVRPRQDHWYIHFLAADPAIQGKGIGSRLLEHGLERLNDGDPAYLESSNDSTTRLYERFDFLPAGKIPMWPGKTIGRMWRPRR